MGSQFVTTDFDELQRIVNTLFLQAVLMIKITHGPDAPQRTVLRFLAFLSFSHCPYGLSMAPKAEVTASAEVTYPATDRHLGTPRRCPMQAVEF